MYGIGHHQNPYRVSGANGRWISAETVASTAVSRDLDRNYRPINILVFRNGDSYDCGTEVSVTRRQFPNWLTLLDYLTEKLRLVDGAVHAIYSVDGEEIRTFQELENGQWYVGAGHGKFRAISYGAKVPAQWKGAPADGAFNGGPKGISSKESLEIYLRRRGYKPVVGDVWDDSQFDLMKSTNVFASPLARRREYSRGLQERRRSRAPSRTRSADGLNGGRRSVRATRRSKTEETISRGRGGAKGIRQAQSLPSGTRLPHLSTTNGRYSNGQPQHGARSTAASHHHQIHFQNANAGGRPGTATMSSTYSANRRTHAHDATQRIMQWNAPRSVVVTTATIPTRAPTPGPPPRANPPVLDNDSETSMYKPVDPRVAKQQEDRAYRFYERQKALELKREILERASKRPFVGVAAGSESVVKNVVNGRALPDSHARNPQTSTPRFVQQITRHPQQISSTKPPPPHHRLPPSVQTGMHSHTILPTGRHQVPPLKASVSQKQRITDGRSIDKSPRWVDDLSLAVDKLAREVSTLSRRRNGHRTKMIEPRSHLYDSD